MVVAPGADLPVEDGAQHIDHWALCMQVHDERLR